MSNALVGETGGYVPCEELAADMPPDPLGPIVGSNVGYVAQDEAAASLPVTPAGAIRGSNVGYVANPCLVPILYDVDFVQFNTWTADVVNGGAPTWGVGSPVLQPRSPGSGGVVADWIDTNVTSPPDGPKDQEHREYYLAMVSGIIPIDAVRLQATLTATGPSATPAQGALVSWQLYTYHHEPWFTTEPGWIPAGAVLLLTGAMVTTDPPVAIDVTYLIPGGASLFTQFFMICTASEGDATTAPPGTYGLFDRYTYPADWTVEASIEMSSLDLTALIYT